MKLTIYMMLTYYGTMVKVFSFSKILFHENMELKKVQNRDYTTQKVISLIQQEHLIHLFHTLNGLMERM